MFGIIWASCWNHVCIMLASFRHHFGIILASFWHHVCILLASCWHHAGTLLEHFRDSLVNHLRQIVECIPILNFGPKPFYDMSPPLYCFICFLPLRATSEGWWRKGGARDFTWFYLMVILHISICCLYDLHILLYDL